MFRCAGRWGSLQDHSFQPSFHVCAGKSAAPLAAGNTVVVKPPEQAPLSALRLAELIEDCSRRACSMSLPAADKKRAQSAGRSSPSRQDRTDRQRRRGARGDAKRCPTRSSLFARAWWQERVDRIPRCGPGGSLQTRRSRGMNFAWCGQSCGSTSRAFSTRQSTIAVRARSAGRIGAFQARQSRRLGDHDGCHCRPDAVSSG